MTKVPLFAILVLFALTLLIPQSAFATLTVNGNAADKATFQTMLEICSGHSRNFTSLINDIQDPAKPNVTINLGRGNAMVDTYNGGGSQDLDLSDVEQFPMPTRNANPPPAWNMPPPAPAWGGTQCEQLAHVLGEGRESAKINGGPNDYGQCHGEGFNEQNRVRQDYGQQGNAAPGGGRPTPGGGMDGTTNYGTHSETVHFNAAGQVTGITYN